MLDAIGANHYWVVLRQWRPDGSDIVMPHIGPLTVDQIIARWREWQRRNAARADIYIRVADNPPPAVMVDDLTADRLRQLLAEQPVRAAVETSPNNFQAWVARPANANALDYSRQLATKYAGDPGAVQARQPGRLPGLTNRKPKHARPDGRGPWVRLRHCDPLITAQDWDEPRAPRAAAAARTPGDSLPARLPPLTGRNGRSPSEDDWAVARRMIARGVSVDSVRATILDRALARGKRCANQYADRTALKAASFAPTGRGAAPSE